MKKIVRLTENQLVNIVKRVLSEQQIPKGYKDITQWVTSPQGVLYIPDGEYFVDGSGYQGKIKSKDGKDTGYLITLKSGIRGLLPQEVEISQNGTELTYSEDIDKLYLNETILNSSGLRKK